MKKQESGPISIFSVAKRLGARSNWTLTNLKMQKMCYIAHMFHLGNCDSPLIKGKFEAWIYGPVYPALYHQLKRFGSRIIPSEALQKYPNIPDGHTGLKFLDGAVDELSERNLIGITHWKEGAWHKNYDHYVPGIMISNTDILEEFNRRAELAKERKKSKQLCIR